MAEPSRGIQISRRRWLQAGLVLPLFRAQAANPLIVTFDGDNLHVSSFGVHFLRGKSLNRLKEGSTVTYLASLTLYRDAFVSPMRKAEFRFSVSYDVLGSGDQFAVVAPGPPARRSSSLSQSATEDWCLKNVAIAAAGLAPDRQFWLQLDLKTSPPRLSAVFGESGIFVDMIDVFTPVDLERQTFQAGPLRLADLKSKGRAG